MSSAISSLTGQIPSTCEISDSVTKLGSDTTTQVQTAVNAALTGSSTQIQPSVSQLSQTSTGIMGGTTNAESTSSQTPSSDSVGSILKNVTNTSQESSAAAIPGESRVSSSASQSSASRTAVTGSASGESSTGSFSSTHDPIPGWLFWIVPAGILTAIGIGVYLKIRRGGDI